MYTRLTNEGFYGYCGTCGHGGHGGLFRNEETGEEEHWHYPGPHDCNPDQCSKCGGSGRWSIAGTVCDGCGYTASECDCPPHEEEKG